MAVSGSTLTAFDAEVARSLSALGASPADRAIDAMTDPIGAARALADRGAAPVLLRGAPELGAAAEGYGPAPADPAWIRIEGKAPASLKLAPLRLGEGGSAESPAPARVAVETRTLPCCDAPACDRRRTHVSAWLSFAASGKSARPRLLFAEARSLDAARAEALVEPFAARLAKALGVPLETAHGTEPADAIASRPVVERDGDEESPPIDAAALARFMLRTEAAPLVLRDHASAGPRASASRNVVIGLVLLAVAVPLWIEVAQRASAGETGVALGLGAGAMLLSLTAYAFLGVARFSSKYGARSSPLLWLERDRFVVAPWVNRTGGIDLKPEGRFGAAIPVGELNGVEVHARGGVWAVELDTEHGAIDVLAAPSEQVARHWAVVIARAAASVRHPGGPSAKQRLRARTKGKSEGSGARGAPKGGAAPREAPAR